MADVIVGLNLGIGAAQILLTLMAATHLLKGMRLTRHDERILLGFFLAIMLFSATDRIIVGILSTPTNIANIQDLPAILYAIPIVSRVLLGLSLWAAVLWTWFVIWARR